MNNSAFHDQFDAPELGRLSRFIGGSDDHRLYPASFCQCSSMLNTHFPAGERTVRRIITRHPRANTRRIGHFSVGTIRAPPYMKADPGASDRKCG